MELDKKNRDKNVNSLKKILSKNKFSNNKKLAEFIENSIYNFSSEYAINNNTLFLLVPIYNDKFEKIKCLLESSDFIIKSLKDKKIDPKKIAFLKPEELNPDKYVDIVTRKQIEEFKKSNQATTDAYKCPKCKQRKCTVEEKQTRSGDEAATVFVQCKNPDCEFKFKF